MTSITSSSRASSEGGAVPVLAAGAIRQHEYAAVRHAPEHFDNTLDVVAFYIPLRAPAIPDRPPSRL
jgi:hypothetical protein